MGEAPKSVNVRLIQRTDKDGQTDRHYAILDRLMAAHHPDLIEAEARVAIAHHLSWQPDRDGRVRLGKAKKVTDLDKEFHEHDFVIVLNAQAVYDMSDEHLAALIDHELCHCAVSHDEEGEIKRDTRGRAVFRIRKHDLEEFRCIVERHGVWKADIAEFVTAAVKAPKSATPLFDGLGTASSPGPKRTPLDIVTDDGLMKAAEDLCPKKPGETMTLECGGRKVTLTSETRKKIHGLRQAAKHTRGKEAAVND